MGTGRSDRARRRRLTLPAQCVPARRRRWENRRCHDHTPARLRRPPPRSAADPSRRPRRRCAQGRRHRAGPARLPRRPTRAPVLHAFRERPGRDVRPARGLARGRGRRAAAAAADRGPPQRDRRRQHPQDPVAAARRRPRRERAHALSGPGRVPRADHGVRVEPGRLRHGLPLLRHRPGRPDPQHVDGRDRRAGPRGRPAPPPTGNWAAADRPAGRAGCRTSCSWAWASRSPTRTGSWPRCTA